MQTLYFAYGSNLFLPRMRERVPSAQLRGRGRLAGRRLCVDKRGRDGTAKANLRREAGAAVWGVLYQIDASHWPALDACEAGYTRIAVQVDCEGEGLLSAHTYVSRLRIEQPWPSASYKRLMVEGARAQGLPEDWIAVLEALPERPDPDLS